MVPPCLRLYRPEEFEEKPVLCTSQQQVQEVLSDMRARFPYKLLPRDQVRKAAQKKRNAESREKRGKKSEAKASKNARRADDCDAGPSSKVPKVAPGRP